MRQSPHTTSQPTNTGISPPLKIARYRALSFLLLIMTLVNTACAFMGSATPPAANRITRLPTFTSTPAAPSAPTATMTPQAVAAPLPIQTPTEIPTPTPFSGGWIFNGVWSFSDQDEGSLRLYGDVVNESSASLEVINITGTFYDELGQIVADGNTTGSWPVAVVPPGSRLPFALVVPGLPAADSFDLRVEAKPSAETPRQDFEILEVTPSTEDSDYCLSGKLHNTGSELQSYLVIVAVLFDSQDRVINYADYREDTPIELSSGQTKDFKICGDSFNQVVARYELRAWGL